MLPLLTGTNYQAVDVHTTLLEAIPIDQNSDLCVIKISLVQVRHGLFLDAALLDQFASNVEPPSGVVRSVYK